MHSENALRLGNICPLIQLDKAVYCGDELSRRSLDGLDISVRIELFDIRARSR